MKLGLIVFLIALMNSCSSIKSDAKAAAEKYCNCFTANSNKYEFETVVKKCDSLIINKYPLYKYYHLYILNDTFQVIRPTLRDSIHLFVSNFAKNIENSCPNYFINHTNKMH